MSSKGSKNPRTWAIPKLFYGSSSVSSPGHVSGLNPSGCWQRSSSRDIVESTRLAAELGDSKWRELLETHNRVVRGLLTRFRGNEVDTAGDGFLATFDGPARAVECACEAVDAVRELGLEMRAGVHTGECSVADGKVRGIAVHIGARVLSQARSGEVLVSQTVKDLVAGSGIEFADRGVTELKGVPGDAAAVEATREHEGVPVRSGTRWPGQHHNHERGRLLRRLTTRNRAGVPGRVRLCSFASDRLLDSRRARCKA